MDIAILCRVKLLGTGIPKMWGWTYLPMSLPIIKHKANIIINPTIHKS
jgi:hypothetical protein